MSNNDSFLLLGQTGVGKSTLIKILSGNESCKIGHGKKSETQNIQSYECCYEKFNFNLIDTPGYDDSNGNDPKNYAHIRQVLGSGKYKIKGIILLLSFQEARFGESHRKGLEKIVNLFPLDNFWDYITVVITKTYCDQDDDIEQLKKQNLKEYQEIFDVLISAFHKTKNIKIVKFSSIKTVFIDSRIKVNKIENIENLIKILKKSIKLDPFFHTMKTEEKTEKLMIINKNDRNLGDLYDVKYKVFRYYNEKGKEVKVISRPIDKKFIKQIKKNEYDGEFQENCWKTTGISSGIGVVACVGTFALAFFCPPAAMAALAIEYIAAGVEVGSLAANGIKTASEYLSNKEFNEQTVIDEIKIEEDNL
jgi:GTPase SAR1 family protein